MISKRIVFFTPELSGYFLYNLEYLSKYYNVEILVFSYRNNKEAPYKLKISEKIEHRFVEDNTIDKIKKITANFNPNLIVIAGWNNKIFKQIALIYKKQNIPVVMSFDNLWKSSLKQYIFLLFGYKFIKSFADFVWIPGYPQYYYAKKLGFKEGEIILNYYNGNYLDKNTVGEKYISIKKKNFPKTIIFIGRFVKYKMPLELAKVFDKIQRDMNSSWKLILVGNGPLKEKIEAFSNSNIVVKPFMQPDKLTEYIAKQGAFCLPSHREHWGLVVHEAASVGLPLILSDSVGASSTFLIDGYNGYRFKTKNLKSLEDTLISIMNKNDEELIEMSTRSLEMSKKITYDIWSSSILSAIRNRK